jgi:hypothetical protein
VTRIVFHPNGLRDLERDPKVADILGRVAEQVARDADTRAWSHLELSSRSGVGHRGAFGQAVMSGSGALACEFGTRRQPARAPLRAALRVRRRV